MPDDDRNRAPLLHAGARARALETTIPSFLAFVTVFVCLTTVNPAAVSWLRAAEAVSPLTSGTFAVVGALAITSETLAAHDRDRVRTGDWSTTSPAVAVLDVCVVVLNVKPAFFNACVAVLSVSPTTLGTAAVGLPAGTVTVTRVPTSGFWPAPGSVLMTSPAATVGEL